MRGNSKAVVCYKLKGWVANAFNEYHADKLPDVGMYSQDNVFYRPWHTEEEIDLTRLFPPLERTLLRRPTNGTNAPTNGRILVVRTPTNGTNGEGGKVAKNVIPPSLQKSFVRSGNWAEFCEGYFKFYPDTTQAELRRVMVDVENTGKEPEAFKGVAFEMYHRYSSNGDRSKFV